MPEFPPYLSVKESYFIYFLFLLSYRHKNMITMLMACDANLLECSLKSNWNAWAYKQLLIVSLCFLFSLFFLLLLLMRNIWGDLVHAVRIECFLSWNSFDFFILLMMRKWVGNCDWIFKTHFELVLDVDDCWESQGWFVENWGWITD